MALKLPQFLVQTGLRRKERLHAWWDKVAPGVLEVCSACPGPFLWHCPSQVRVSDLKGSLAASSLCYYVALCVTSRSRAPLCPSINRNINLPFTLRQEKTLIPKSSYRHVIPFNWVQPVLWTEQTQCNFLSYNSCVCGIGQWNECSK